MIDVNKISDYEVLVELSENVSPEEVEKEFNEILNESFHTVIVDCSRLIHLGHKVLGKLYMFNIDLSISRRKFVLTGCPDNIRNLLHLLTIDEGMNIVKDPFKRLSDSKEQ